MNFMVRVGPEVHAAALAARHTRPMDFTGRPMRGFVYVTPPGLKTAAALRKWVGLGVAFGGQAPRRRKRKAASLRDLSSRQVN